jgi:nitroreductase
MEKLAQTDYPILDLLQRRWSPRAFSERLVEAEKLLSLFEAARWAPSSFNEQEWYFVLTTKQKPEEHARLLSCLTERNQEWASLAPVLMISVAKLHFDHTGKPNRHAFYDVGMAVGNLITQATALDLFVHQMAGFFKEKVAELYGIPDGFEPVAAIALGYAGELDRLPEQFRAPELAPRSRKLIQSFVFEGQWGQTSPLVKKSE